MGLHLRDRQEAGELLAEKLLGYKDQPAVVLALPRGGVVVGAAVAKRLGAPLDLVIPRKVGHPGFAEYAVCAVTEDGRMVCNENEVARIDPAWLKAAIESERAEAKRRRLRYLAGRKPEPLKGKTAIVVDDGIATGLTILAALQAVKDRGPAKIVVAVAVVPKDITATLQQYADEVVALEVAEKYKGSVGAYYRHFSQVSDEEVMRLMRR